MSAPEAVLLVNVQARRGEALFERAREELVRAGVLLRHAEPVSDPAALPARAAALARAGAERVVVGGGDGTLAAVAGALAGGRAALGVLPLGTANDFARSLGIDAGDLAGAARVVAGGVVRRVDVGRVGERAFLNAASAGVSSGVARRVDAELKQVAGALAYPVAGAAEAAQVEPFRVRLSVDGAIREGLALQVLVGNGRFHGGGRLVAPEAALDDRLLDVYAVEVEAGEGAERVRTMTRLAGYALRLLQGRHLDDPAVFHARGRAVTLETDPALEVDADGERACRTPVAFRVEPGALRVLAPA